jgi:ribonuclease HI
MNGFALFTDVSLNPQRKVGVGGYLLVHVQFLEREPHGIEQSEVSSRLKMKMFEETSSTKLEVQTVLWALESSWEDLIGSAGGDLRIYTDSQCVAELLRRRSGLESSDFIARRSGRQLPHASLYRAFYAAYDQLGFQVIKVAGHSRACFHDTVHRIFSNVDKEVRKELGGRRERP